jgi:hypothetical protein
LLWVRTFADPNINDATSRGEAFSGAGAEVGADRFQWENALFSYFLKKLYH